MYMYMCRVLLKNTCIELHYMYIHHPSHTFISASTGLVCSIYSVARSVMVVLTLWAVGIAAVPSLELPLVRSSPLPLLPLITCSFFVAQPLMFGNILFVL